VPGASAFSGADLRRSAGCAPQPSDRARIEERSIVPHTGSDLRSTRMHLLADRGTAVWVLPLFRRQALAAVLATAVSGQLGLDAKDQTERSRRSRRP
jgi:hypothetical protein